MEAKPVILHGKQYWKVGDVVYARVKDKLLAIDHFDDNGKPILASECWSEKTPNDAGGMDCTVHVPCLQIAVSKPNSP